MQFAFTEEQQMIRDTAEQFLSEVSTSEAVRRAMVTEQGFDEALWRRICDEMYWQAIHVPEAYGGLGLGMVELVAVLEEMGRYLLCSPFFSTVCLGAQALLVAGNEDQKAQWLAAIAEGRTTATLAYKDRGRDWSVAAVAATWERDGDDYILNGRLAYVPDGHTADMLVIAAREPGSHGEQGISLFLVTAEAAGLSRRWVPTMDQTRKQAELQLDGVRVAATDRLGEEGKGGQALQKILHLVAICIAAEQSGGARQVLDLSVAYTQERVQFGRTIASYQAIKHKAADMMLKTEVSRSAIYYAACVAQEALFGEGDEATAIAAQLPEAASMAKAYCSDAYFFNAGNAIQLFGGVGFTWEYDVHLYFKRAKSSETMLGDGAWHREQIAARLLDDCGAAEGAR